MCSDKHPTKHMEKHKKNVGLFKTGCAISRSFVSLSLSRHTGISPHSALNFLHDMQDGGGLQGLELVSAFLVA
jgi:hypothetical protein